MNLVLPRPAFVEYYILLQVYDWEKSGSHRCLGVVQVTAQDISQGTKRLTLNHPKKDKQTKAELVFESMHLVERPTFLDYLNGGLQIGFTVAIDFTGSNRPPEMRDSLHNLLRSPNQYEAAIQGVGHIIDYYNATKYVLTIPQRNEPQCCRASSCRTEICTASGEQLTMGDDEVIELLLCAERTQHGPLDVSLYRRAQIQLTTAIH